MRPVSECMCICHQDENILHITACCDGQCPHCLRYFRGLEEHIKEEHQHPQPWQGADDGE